MEKFYLARLRKLSGSPAAHLINYSALPDKLFHPRHQPIIFYVNVLLYIPYDIMYYISTVYTVILL